MLIFIKCLFKRFFFREVFVDYYFVCRRFDIFCFSFGFMFFLVFNVICYYIVYWFV